MTSQLADWQRGGFNVSRETFERLRIYRDLLVRWQKRINLIGPSTVSDIDRRHFADCLQMAPLLGQTEIVVDLGSGAGFPGLIIAMILDERGGGQVHLIESAGKKCAFLREVARETGLRDGKVSVEIHQGRIENVLGNLVDVSLITARALAPLPGLFELVEDRISANTRALFQKGEHYRDEIDLARKDWRFEEVLHGSGIDGGSVIIELRNVQRL